MKQHRAGSHRGRRTSRRQVFRTAGLLGVGLAGAALIGCGEGGDDTTPTPSGSNGMLSESTPEPAEGNGNGQQGGRLGWFTQPQSNFNVVTNYHAGHELAGLHIYDRPFTPRLDERVYEMEAAESVEIADDTTVVITLKEGLTFQDRDPVNGRAVSAEDIVEMQYYARESEGAHNNSFQVNSMDSVEATDDHTVVYHLARPNAYLFTSTQLGHPGNQSIVPAELLDDLDAAEPVGSGPYELREYQFGARFTYHRSDSYRRANEGLPYIDERVVFELSDTAAQESAFRGEQLSVLPNPSTEMAERLIQDLGDEITVDEYMDLGNFTTGMSAEREQWDDIRAREAFYRLLNREQLVDLVDIGMAVPAPGFLSVGLETWLVDEADTAGFWRHDPDDARALLDAAGFDLDRSYELITFPGARTESGIQVLQQQLANVGIQTDIELIQFSEYLGPKMNTGDFDISINTHPAFDSPQMQLRWHHTDPQTIISKMNLREPEVDAMIEESEILLDHDAHAELVKQIQIELLSHYARFLQLNTRTVQHLRWAYVRDWEINAATTHALPRPEAWIDL